MDRTDNGPFDLVALHTDPDDRHALTHCIEALTNLNHHELGDAYALAGIRLISRHIERAVNDGRRDRAAREAMSMGSLCGGMTLGSPGCAGVHALAYPLGGQFHVPHGVANSLLLPYVLAFNASACPDRIALVGRAMGLDDADEAALVRRTLEHVAALGAACGIPRSMRDVGVPADAIGAMADAAMQVVRLLKNNPRPMSRDDAHAIYSRAWAGAEEVGVRRHAGSRQPQEELAP